MFNYLTNNINNRHFEGRACDSLSREGSHGVALTLPTGNPDERDGMTGMDWLLPLSVACHSGWVPALQLFIHLRESKEDVE